MYVKYVNLSDEEYSEYNNGDTKFIKLEKNNIFIGKNNSGKSRLVRKILSKEYDTQYLVNNNVNDFIELKKILNKILTEANEYVQQEYKKTYLYNENIRKRIYRNTTDEERLGLFICNIVYYDYHDAVYNKMHEKQISQSRYAFQHDNNYGNSVFSRIEKEKIFNLYNKIMENVEVILPKTIFFPALLSLRKLDNTNTEEPDYSRNMSKMFYNNYFTKIGKFENNIKTGQEIYNDMKEELLGLNVERDQFLKYEEYIGKNFFDGKNISIFIKDKENNIYIKEENEQPYPIYMLGDGLQTLITITYYLIMNKDKPLKVFIDEPEIHLHPGLQRLLITKLQEFDNCQFFISTHSSSMIDICDEYDDDTAIICVDKIDGKKYAYNSAYDDMNLYELIGTRPSSIILSNCTIWVEGPTDIYYIDSILKLYEIVKNKKKYLLGYNYNYAFNGSINIASKIDFDNDEQASVKINKLSKNNFIIFDSDNMDEESVNYEKIKKIRDKLGKRCYVIRKLKTIENIIPPKILYEYFAENYKPKTAVKKQVILEFIDKLEEIYNTNEYYKIDIAETMAKYINQKIKPANITKNREYAKNLWKHHKYNLALFFAEKIKNIEVDKQEKTLNTIMPEFINMIKEIQNFIEENNTK